MITSFDNNVFNVTGQMNAITLNDINVLNKNEKIKVYIPKVMVNIDKGEPLIKKIPTSGKSVFKNANGGPTLTGPILYEKNYFETDLNATSNIDDLNNTSSSIIEEMNTSLKELAEINNLTSINRQKKLTFNINKNTDIRVEFLNGKLNRLAFTTIDKTKTSKSLE